jgi:hypothetical protein
MLMIDLCSGMGGASRVMREHGWRVVTVDIEPAFIPDIIADVKEWKWTGMKPDFVWASPPCNEFAREFMPWSKTGIDPDMSIVLACKRIIDDCNPKYWVIENVRGAVRWFIPYLGRPSLIINPFYFWGTFPPISRPKLTRRHKESMSSSWAAIRALIPLEISNAFCNAIELQYDFEELRVRDAQDIPE